MSKFSSAAVISAIAILIDASAAFSRDSTRPAAGVRRPWAKVVVNSPTPKAGSYYKGVSRTPMPNSYGKLGQERATFRPST